MSFSINVNIDDLSLNDKISPVVVSAIQSSIQTSLALVRDKWQTEVQNKLKSTRPLYLQGLGFDSIIFPMNHGFAGAVRLNGKFPNMLENGFPAFDMKVGFSKSNRIKTKKNGGWYLTIPIRHSTPNSYLFGKPMSKDVYGVAKKLGHMESARFKGAGDKSWNGYQHKSNIYDGLTRIIKSYQKATQSQYMTFRRVSDNSDPASWHHPGFSGVKVAEKIMPYAKSTFVTILTNNLSKLK